MTESRAKTGPRAVIALIGAVLALWVSSQPAGSSAPALTEIWRYDTGG